MLDHNHGSNTANGLSNYNTSKVNLQTPIGKGKYGQVYKGVNTENGSLVAIKIFALQGKQSWIAEKGNLTGFENFENFSYAN